MPFIDVQVNGYAGVDFHAEPLTETQIQHVAAKLREDDVRAMLPTITTDSLDNMAIRLRTMRELIDADPSLRELMPAFHIEGPCLSPEDGFRGAHPQQHIRPATVELFKPLVDACGGIDRVAIVTLAPEVDEGLRTTHWLAEQGVIVAAGHTDASLDTMRQAAAAGLSMFTHLGNGSAANMHRHDNIITRALSIDSLVYSLIPDGVHVPDFVLEQYIKIAGYQRCIITTDCMAAASCPPDNFTRGDGTIVEVGEDRVVRLPGTPYFAGSAITMREGYERLCANLSMDASQIHAMCCEQPGKLLDKWLAA